jgi:hypothetical protein
MGVLLTRARARLWSRDQARQKRNDVALHVIITNNRVFSMSARPYRCWGARLISLGSQLKGQWVTSR